jgi:hypothetical protein
MNVILKKKKNIFELTFPKKKFESKFEKADIEDQGYSKIQFEMKFMMKINGKGNFKIFRVNNILAFNLSNNLKNLICFRMNKNKNNF